MEAKEVVVLEGIWMEKKPSPNMDITNPSVLTLTTSSPASNCAKTVKVGFFSKGEPSFYSTFIFPLTVSPGL